MTITQDLQSSKVGDTLIQPFEFVDDETNAPIPQVGKRYTFTLKLDESAEDATSPVFLDWVVQAGSESDAGLVTVRVDRSVTSQLEATKYHYELKEIITSAPEDIVLTRFDGKLGMEY